MATMTFKANLIPDNTGTQKELGSSSAKWKINGGGTSGQFLAYDGSWAVPAGTYSLPTASSSTKGGIKVGTGLTISSEVLNHSNSVTAQTTQAVYPIKIDAQGHISAYGNAVTSMTPTSHSHGNITNAGAIGSTASLVIVTTTNGILTTADLSVSAPSASGSTTAFIDSISQASNGKITVTKKNLDTSGTWSGNAATATKATQDGAGNVITSTYVKKSGDTMTGNLIMYTSSNGASPAIIFQRGTFTDDYNDWRIQNSSGLLYFGQRGSGSSDFDSTIYFNNSGEIHATKVYGAVWNDYAEYRKDNQQEKDIQIPGKCVREIGDGSLALTNKRLERGCEIISDTFGFALGQDEENGYNTPIASSGRVLVYPYESIEDFASHIGWAVCSGPDGTVSIMTEEEEEKYPSRIIGTISEIPDYEEWGTGKVKVNGRVWIRIR